MSAAALQEGHTIQLRQAGGRCCAAVEGLAVFGEGETCEAALADLDRRFTEMRAFCDRTGLALETFARRRPPAGTGWAPSLRKAAIVVACFALMMIPLSYALSSAAERVIETVHLRGGSDFWRGLDDSLVRAAAPEAAPSPEREARRLAALRVIVQRLQPYASEIKPLFGCSPAP